MLSSVSTNFRTVLNIKGNGDTVQKDFTNFLQEMRKQKKLSLLFKLKAKLGSIEKANSGQ